jgi:hypothetical protein
MNKDQKLLAEAYEQAVLGNSDFESKIKKLAQRDPYGQPDSYVIGVTPEGKKYAVIEEYDKYDDGDRWITEINYRLEIEGEEGKYISDAKAKELMAKARQEYPELNK